MVVESAGSRSRCGVDAAFAEQLHDALARLVVADHAQQARLRAERGGVARDVGGAAQALFLALHMHDRHRRFRRDAVDVAEPVAVEHDVADHQHARRAELRARHDGELSAPAWPRTAPGMASGIGRKFSGLGIGRPIAWYSMPSSVIASGSYRLRPSKTTGVFSTALSCVEVRAAECLPFGDDDQRVGAVERFHPACSRSSDARAARGASCRSSANTRRASVIATGS